MWMSEARRWMALKTVESTSLMIGEESAVMRSIDRTSSPSSLSCTSWMRKSSVASSSTRWVDSDFCRISSIAEVTPTRTSSGWPSSSSISSSLPTSVGSLSTTAMPPGQLLLRQEAVAQHQLERDRVEEVGVDAKAVEIDELEPVPLGELARPRPLVGRAQAAAVEQLGRQRRLRHHHRVSVPHRGRQSYRARRRRARPLHWILPSAENIGR